MQADAVVIGGGFYGAVIAVYLAKQRGLRVVLLEKESALLSRASYNNQARIHNGYHYPRSFTTAFRSRVNFPKFVHDWPFAIKRFTQLYAIARSNSKVTAKQFENFCRQIGAKIESASADFKILFEPKLIEAVYRVEEYAFDANRLAEWVYKNLREVGVEVRLSVKADALSRTGGNTFAISTLDRCGAAGLISCQYVFNCTYSGLNQLAGEFTCTQAKLKHEIAEMVLIQVPRELREIGVTVMDGPFFSIMPFPARGLHTISHVRYTPHFSWQDEGGLDPYARLAQYDREPRVDRMLRDAARYIPTISNANRVESFFEVKTILESNEGDDGRPILFERHAALPGCYSILGGKIDNIYDVLERLDREL